MLPKCCWINARASGVLILLKGVKEHHIVLSHIKIMINTYADVATLSVSKAYKIDFLYC